MKENEIIAMVDGFAKTHPDTVAKLRKIAKEIIGIGRSDMTTQEYETAQIAFCLGGVWALTTINRQQP
ncbi:hypothetical protein [Lepagella muris]|uniref:Uncharacterized protein n=1 Tax=Lepagella muris TaxID=3032870 RepID=A0AC61RJD1_9BACT|nr:hypothetical protein [Lepagella muris]TGY79984.1 hypothetical protein E5331_04135 [Lepagella muris]THG53222.1 hypothetical protein E5984_03905 [Bacteroidales bacterium]TKC64893.1 hypothetical protein E5359_001900 [Bacteroidales bacterium]